MKSAMEKAKDANPDYVPAWRRIDAKAEKGYIATQETQEVKIAFTDEYIPPGLQKEKQDATDEKYYRHRVCKTYYLFVEYGKLLELIINGTGVDEEKWLYHLRA